MRDRPFVTLKLAAWLDGYVAPQAGKHWLTGERADYVRELRAGHDAVMVEREPIRSDDPLLTVRPLILGFVHTFGWWHVKRGRFRGESGFCTS